MHNSRGLNKPKFRANLDPGQVKSITLIKNQIKYSRYFEHQQQFKYLVYFDSQLFAGTYFLLCGTIF